ELLERGDRERKVVETSSRRIEGLERNLRILDEADSVAAGGELHHASSPIGAVLSKELPEPEQIAVPGHARIEIPDRQRNVMKPDEFIHGRRSSHAPSERCRGPSA